MPQTSLDDIMSGRDAAPVDQQPAPEFSDADRAANPIGTAKAIRDEQGRFAPKSETQQPEPQDPEEGDEPDAGQQRQHGSVPPQALAAERQKRKQAQDQLATMQRELAELRGAVMATRQQPQAAPPPAPEAPPEFWQDPNAATDFRVRSAIDPIRQQLDSFKITMSRNLAEQTHGKETVDSAVQALTDLRQANPGEYQRLEALAAGSMHPVDDVVRWHKQQRALQEVGEDPDAYFQRRLTEWQAQQGASQQNDPPQSPAPQAAPRLPSSFAKLPTGGPRGGQGYGGPRALSDIMPRG